MEIVDSDHCPFSARPGFPRVYVTVPLAHPPVHAFQQRLPLFPSQFLQLGKCFGREVVVIDFPLEEWGIRLADIVIDRREKVRRVAAEHGDFVDFPHFRDVRTFEQSNPSGGGPLNDPDSHQFIEHRTGRRIPAIQFDEFQEADVSPVERKIRRLSRFVAEPAIPQPARDDTRRPVDPIQGPKIVLGRKPLHAQHLSPGKAGEDGYPRFRWFPSRNIEFLRGQVHVDALRDIGESLVGNAVPQEEHDQGAKQIRDGCGNGFCDVLFHIWDDSPKYGSMSTTIFISRIDGWNARGTFTKNRTWRKAKFPLVIDMVPLKLFFVGYPRERISSGSGVPKAGFEPERVSPTLRFQRYFVRELPPCLL